MTAGSRPARPRLNERAPGFGAPAAHGRRSPGTIAANGWSCSRIRPISRRSALRNPSPSPRSSRPSPRFRPVDRPHPQPHRPAAEHPQEIRCRAGIPVHRRARHGGRAGPWHEPARRLGHRGPARQLRDCPRGQAAGDGLLSGECRPFSRRDLPPARRAADRRSAWLRHARELAAGRGGDRGRPCRARGRPGLPGEGGSTIDWHFPTRAR